MVKKTAERKYSGLKVNFKSVFIDIASNFK